SLSVRRAGVRARRQVSRISARAWRAPASTVEPGGARARRFRRRRADAGVVVERVPGPVAVRAFGRGGLRRDARVDRHALRTSAAGAGNGVAVRCIAPALAACGVAVQLVTDMAAAAAAHAPQVADGVQAIVETKLIWGGVRALWRDQRRRVD